jgi:cytochrome c oxidase assembly factor CtaG
MRHLLILAVLLSPSAAHAHSGHTHPAEAATWSLDNTLTLPLLFVAIGLYSTGVARLWRRAGLARGVRPGQAACFAAGWLTLALTLMSPLHVLSEKLFVAHMAEHEILMAVAAPLLVLARPLATMFWALPQAWRAPLGGATRLAPLRALWRFLTDPLAATILHGIALWAWHIPALFKAALESEALHWLQHLSFFVTGLLFWWSILNGRLRERGYGAAIFYLFATALHSGFLGILLTFAAAPLFGGQDAAADWGLTRLEDQQLAGLIMWVPAGLVYAAAALALLALWIRSSGLRAFTAERGAATS